MSVLSALVVIGIFAMWLGRSAVKEENGSNETCLHLDQDQVNFLLLLLLFLLKESKLKLHLESSQLDCVEDCHLAQPRLGLHCNVEGWSQAVVSCFSLLVPLVVAVNVFLLKSDAQAGFVDLSVACDAVPGLQVATCRSCDEDTGFLPHTCSLVYSFSEAEGSAAKEVASAQEKMVGLCLMLLLCILVFMLFRELQRKQRVPRSIWQGRGGNGGNVEVEKLRTKMRLEKSQREREKGRLPESGGCCQEKAREMAVDSGNSDGRTAPTFLLEHSMIKERKGRKKAGKYAVDTS